MDTQRVDQFIRAMGWVPTDRLRDQVRAGMAAMGAEAQEQGGGEAELRRMVARLAAHVRPTCGELWAEAERLLNRTAPPSAPVGVDELVRKVCERLDKVADYAHTIDDETVVVALSNLPAVLDRALSEALSQQPAAVDEAMVERAARAWCAGTDTPFDQLPDAGKARCLEDMRVVLTAALAAQQQEAQP